MAVTINLLPRTGIVYDVMFSFNLDFTQSVVARLFEERGAYRGKAYFVGKDEFGMVAEYTPSQRKFEFAIEPDAVTKQDECFLATGVHQINAEFMNTSYIGNIRRVKLAYGTAIDKNSLEWLLASSKTLCSSDFSFRVRQLDLGK